MKKIFTTVLGLCAACSLSAQTWIWYPGDFEIWLGNIMNSRRTERGTFFPPFWKMDSHYVTVEFSRQVDIPKAETITIGAEGRYNVKVDGKMLFGQPRAVTLAPGHHKINIKVWNQATPPAIFVDGQTVKSDSSWLVTNEDKEWIDESGKASDTSTSVYMQAGSWNFDHIGTPPSKFSLPTTAEAPVSARQIDGGTLYDFGQETFGYLTLKGLSGNGRISVYYGESAEEATDTAHCETLDKIDLDGATAIDASTGSKVAGGRLAGSKAFRYVFVRSDGTARADGVGMLYEYLPEKERGTFKCDDELVNKMWNVGVRTLQLTTREFFIDGIKRDRWTWSGDASQSYLMNYYLFFDSPTVKRTMRQLRGKDPVTSHVNTIMDYTFYWLASVGDYYMYTADTAFVREIYPRMKTLMDYCLSRTDDNGMMQGLAGDWVFVDWSPKPMDKHGELSFEQILFCRSLETMAICARLNGDNASAQDYEARAGRLRRQIPTMFWNDDRHALVHNVIGGKQGTDVTRYANIFGILYDYLDKNRQNEVAKWVLHNDEIMRITTPYMRFYEMEALCKLGEQGSVMREMKNYWGGMLAHGATSFWEAYDAKIDSAGTTPLRDHLSMYGRPYGKSLCHAWGASPVYLLGKYFLGVKPTKPGYTEWEARPSLGSLKWIEGDVPTPNGTVHVYMNHNTIRIHSDEGTGTLYFHSARKPKASQGRITKTPDGSYSLTIGRGTTVTVKY